MKNIKNTLLLVFLLMPLFHFAQSNVETIKSIQKLMLENYVFIDKAKEVNTHLDQLIKENYFDDYKQPEEFAQVLTAQIRKITNDKHLRISPPIKDVSNNNSAIFFYQDFLNSRTPIFNEMAYFEGNVAYLDFRKVYGDNAEIDLAMQYAKKADAIIIDLRRNGGGSPRMVQYFCSYFFDKELLLSSIYTRSTDSIEEFWVTDVNGVKRPDVPVFIMTSNQTFSGAEDFAYTMQSHKRAKIIGEVTGGGAHPTRGHALNNGFRIGIPYARSINPITKTNWEGVGVIPEVKVTADQSLEKAKALAKVAAELNVEPTRTYLRNLEKALNEVSDNKVNTSKEEKIHKLLSEMIGEKIFNEYHINNLGYSYLFSEKIDQAIIVFKANTQLFSASANTYDSYAEVLVANGQNALALKEYEKAVAIALKEKDSQLEFFQNNLNAFKSELGK